MFKYSFFLIAFLSFSTIIAQTTNDQLSAELDQFIQAQMTQESIPGLSACIVKGDAIVWKGAYGMANFETNTPVTLDTKFTLASISKLFTATACAQLWETGDLDLDENINNFLPITVLNPNFPDIPITTRQLLTHKSSLRDYESDLQLWDNIGDPEIDLATFCERYFVVDGEYYKVSNFAITAPDASSYWYSNAGFTLLGYIVEVVSGVPFDQYCKDNILNSLEMNNAAWFYADLDISEIAMPYNSNFQPYGYFSVPEYPAAMLKADIEELANFLIAYTQRGVFNNTVLVDSNTFSNLVPGDLTNGFGWWGKDSWYGDPSGNFWSHGGFMNGVRTQLNYYPSDSTGLIILTNSEGNYSSIQNKLEEYIPLFESQHTTSIYEPENINFHISPNPVIGSDQLSIKFDTNNIHRKVELVNSKGQVASEIKAPSSSLQIDTSNYPKGIYFVKVIDRVYSVSKKIIIQ